MACGRHVRRCWQLLPTIALTGACLPPWLLPPCSIVEFAEKPKGDALKRMQVDTTILGLDKET